jgi:hypothetical protein
MLNSISVTLCFAKKNSVTLHAAIIITDHAYNIYLNLASVHHTLPTGIN